MVVPISLADPRHSARQREGGDTFPPDTRPRSISAPRGIVTVSIGVAAVDPSVDHSVEDLVKAADMQLYEAKRQGRNRVAGNDG
jgi:GGDEF domain-containing protein